MQAAPFRPRPHQGSKAARIGRGNDGFHRQVAAIDAKLQITQRRRVCGQNMHIDAKAVAEHPERVADAAFSIERIADRKRVNEVSFSGERLFCPCGQNTTNIGLLDFMTAEIDACRKGLAFEASCGNIDNEAIDRETCHAFGSIHRKAN